MPEDTKHACYICESKCLYRREDNILLCRYFYLIGVPRRGQDKQCNKYTPHKTFFLNIMIQVSIGICYVGQTNFKDLNIFSNKNH